MTLYEALIADLDVRLVCKSCGEKQSAYLHKLLERYGPDADFDQAIRQAACILCEQAGQFLVLISEF